MTLVGDAEMNHLLRAGTVDEVIALLADTAAPPDLRKERVRAFVDWAAYGNVRAQSVAQSMEGELLRPYAWEVAAPYLDGSDFRTFDGLSWLFQTCSLDDEMLLLIERARSFTADQDIREFVEYWDDQKRP